MHGQKKHLKNLAVTLPCTECNAARLDVNSNWKLNLFFWLIHLLKYRYKLL